MIKFASKKVNGWKNRYINPLEVQEALWTRQANGFTLDWEERKFLGDVCSLRAAYNKKTFDAVAATIPEEQITVWETV
jgi:hypothetical protein